MTKETIDSPVVGISTCLLGQKVRYDGGHKHDRYITDVLGPYFRFVPVCPELEVGMGVPREAVHLAGGPEAPRMVGNRTGQDWTDRMNRYSERRVLSMLCETGVKAVFHWFAAPDLLDAQRL